MKKCELCKKEGSIQYRVKYENERFWKFICPECLVNISEKKSYIYGGTRKNKSRKNYKFSNLE